MRALRRTVAAAVAAAAFWGTAVSADDLLILSAFPTEQAVLLSHAQPVTEVGAFNGRRFFRGTIAGKSVDLGLTGIGLVDAVATAPTRSAAGLCRASPERGAWKAARLVGRRRTPRPASSRSSPAPRPSPIRSS